MQRNWVGGGGNARIRGRGNRRNRLGRNAHERPLFQQLRPGRRNINQHQADRVAAKDDYQQSAVHKTGADSRSEVRRRMLSKLACCSVDLLTLEADLETELQTETSWERSAATAANTSARKDTQALSRFRQLNADRSDDHARPISSDSSDSEMHPKATTAAAVLGATNRLLQGLPRTHAGNHDFGKKKRHEEQLQEHHQEDPQPRPSLQKETLPELLTKPAVPLHWKSDIFDNASGEQAYHSDHYDYKAIVRSERLKTAWTAVGSPTSDVAEEKSMPHQTNLQNLAPPPTALRQALARDAELDQVEYVFLDEELVWPDEAF